MGGSNSKEGEAAAAAVTPTVETPNTTNSDTLSGGGDGGGGMKYSTFVQPPGDHQSSADSAKSNMEALEKLRDETDLLKDGRYRPASPETIDALRATQSSSVGGPVSTSSLPGLPAERRKMAAKYIKEMEGLDIGLHERRKLAQQWRFFLSCEPIQRGMDAGIVLGSVVAVAAAFNPKRRHPLKLCCIWAGGFSSGMILVPTLLMISETMNQHRIKSKEGELFAKQRRAFSEAQRKQEE